METHPPVIRDDQDRFVSAEEKKLLQPHWDKYKNKQKIADKYRRKKVPDAYDLSGGAMWNNRADNIITPYVNKAFPGIGLTEIHIHKIKEQQIVGVTTDDPIIIKFKLLNGRYYAMDDKCPLPEVNMPDQMAMEIQQNQ